MKFDVLRSIGHNIAYSLSSGASLLIGAYDIDMYGAARRTNSGSLIVDFLAGSCVEGEVYVDLANVLLKCPTALKALCAKHQVDPAAFRRLTAEYSGRWFNQNFAVTVEDQSGRRAVDRYNGTGDRPKILDPQFRLRRLPPLRTYRSKN